MRPAGYESSGRPATSLAPPPSGPAPGAARKLDPPTQPTKLTGRASTPRHHGAHRDPVGNKAARNADRARDALQRSINRRAT